MIPTPTRRLLYFSMQISVFPFERADPSDCLVPLLEGQPPFQTPVGFANGLKIQSHRTVLWGNRRSDLECEACRKYKQERGNSPFLRTRTYAPKSSFLFQSAQNSPLTFVGEQNARASMKGEEHEQATLRRDSGLYRTSKATRRVSKGLGNLERAPC
jgi:hypothetical protein